MRLALRHCGSLDRLLRHHSLEQLNKLTGTLGRSRKCQLLRADRLVDFEHALRQKRCAPKNHVINRGSKRPYISRITLRRRFWGFFTQTQLWRKKSGRAWSSRLACLRITSEAVDLGFSKVTQFHCPVASTKQIVRLDIAVHDLLEVKIFEPVKHVPHDFTHAILRQWFHAFQLARIHHDTARHVLDYENQPLLSLIIENVPVSANIRVDQLLHHRVLLPRVRSQRPPIFSAIPIRASSNLLPRVRHDLHGIEPLVLPAQRKLHLSKRSFSNPAQQNVFVHVLPT
mmetsp:Transcript_14332/g.30880  ORF Transcript_14332/g.30880 Transcript_14332/m.30880 type:complete len:285 (-) Transcript_14332:809-1663(-)